MSTLQAILITVLSAVLFQVASALTVLSPDDLTDVRRWFVGLGVGVANAIGVAIVALYTTGGLTLPRPPGRGGGGVGGLGGGDGSPGGDGTGGGLAMSVVWQETSGSVTAGDSRAQAPPVS